MKIKQRFPNFFSGFEATEHEVTTLDELLEIPWAKAYSENPKFVGMYYSPNDSKFEPAPDYLMALWHKDDGTVTYFVVGYIFGNGADLGLEDYTKFL
ncbi:MAG: hypothetical protein WC516_09840 [Patescibacteria group bacterium]